jgi:predicted DNA-binding ArsR family transcriptional regulator
MKATIESNFNFNFYSIRIFAEILNAITTSKNEAELRKEMKRIKDSFLMSFSSYFDYGFGSNHMWVCEAGKKKGKINIRGVLIELLGFHV